MTLWNLIDMAVWGFAGFAAGYWLWGYLQRWIYRRKRSF